MVLIKSSIQRLSFCTKLNTCVLLKTHNFCYFSGGPIFTYKKFLVISKSTKDFTKNKEGKPPF